MAEGGDTTFENPAYNPYDDPYDDDRFDETTPFIRQTSTPYSYGGENIEMQTMHHETSGLPEKSYAETVFGGGPKTSEAAWVAAKDLFPNMSSSELEVSYNTNGKLQVKMFGAGKKLYSLMTTDRSTGKETINKSLPKEIKTALGQSKYERVQRITFDKRKELKQSEDMALQKEKNKKHMDGIREKLREAQSNLESLENSEAPQRDIDKLKAKIRTLEADHVKARNKYNKSIEAEKDKQSIDEDLAVLEDLEEEDLADVEKGSAREALTAIQKRKEALGARKEHELRTLAYERDPDKIQLAKEKLFELNKSYQEMTNILSKRYLVKN